MLILTRKPGQSIYVGDNIKVTIVEIKGHQIRVGIDAPNDLRIYREEIYLQILEENRQAAQAAMEIDTGLENLTAVWPARNKGEQPSGSVKLSGLSSGKGKRTDSGPEVVIRRKKPKDKDD